ncbi:MAG: methyltransferase domain-containing protein [Candidatus Aenigmarchaeota archaeon]|nr:methyltransferase domain-containing protein [Candidatus Aenigmarchaeota archaeon]
MKKLNIGCGKFKMHGALNVDIDNSVEPDIVWDIERDWNFAKNSEFDEVHAHSIMEHLYGTHHFLGECFRVLKPGGMLYLSVPFFYRYHSHPNDFYRFTKPCVERLLRDHGFEIIEMKTSGGRASALVEILLPTKVGKARNLIYRLLQKVDKIAPNSDSFIDSISVRAKKLQAPRELFIRAAP